MSYSKNPAIAKGVDWLTVWLYVLLVGIGLLSVFSTEHRSGENVVQTLLGFKNNYSKQFFFFCGCIVVAAFILLTDSKLFTATANLSYLLGIVLILATFVVGKEVNGSKSWIPLGFMNLQPVEMCKIFASLALAKFIAQPDMDFKKPRSQAIAAAICFVPAVLSILQSETGLALVYFSFLIPMYREGLPPGYLIAGASVAVLLVVCLLVPKLPLVIAFTVIAVLVAYLLRRQIKRNNALVLFIVGGWLLASAFVWVAVPLIFTKVLKPYQSERIFSAIGRDNPFADKNAVLSPEELKEKEKKRAQQDYNVKQSKIAIGSGGFWGRGFLKGTQTQGDFVPAQRTDFIFTSVGENFGFWGTSLLLAIYLTLLLRLVFLAERQRSTFSRVYGYCVAGIFFFHICVNICVTIGLAPVIGITLPLLSYGGSSLLTFTILLFIFIKLDADRQMVLR
jgi:rod shape determining protein RodA